MRFFILKRKLFTHKKNTHAHFTCARVVHTSSLLLLLLRKNATTRGVLLAALLLLPSRSRVSREKRDVSFFLFVS